MPLTKAKLRACVDRLCGLPCEAPAEDWRGNPADAGNIERALRSAARDDRDAERITELLAARGLRPDAAAIARAAERKPLAELTVERPERVVCMACGGTKWIVGWRLIWIEEGQRRARRVADLAQGWLEADALPAGVGCVDVVSASEKCECARERAAV